MVLPRSFGIAKGWPLGPGQYVATISVAPTPTPPPPPSTFFGSTAQTFGDTSTLTFGKVS